MPKIKTKNRQTFNITGREINEYFDAVTTRNRDMFYRNLAFKTSESKKKYSPDHKISEKRTLTNFFFYLDLSIFCFPRRKET